MRNQKEWLSTKSNCPSFLVSNPKSFALFLLSNLRLSLKTQLKSLQWKYLFNYHLPQQSINSLCIVILSSIKCNTVYNLHTTYIQYMRQEHTWHIWARTIKTSIMYKRKCSKRWGWRDHLKGAEDKEQNYVVSYMQLEGPWLREKNHQGNEYKQSPGLKMEPLDKWE